MPTKDYSISRGSYSAAVSAMGGALRELQHQGRDLVVSFAAGGAVPDYRGVICVPWPNRLSDGHYSFAGKGYTAVINEPERQTALHGLATHIQWDLEEHLESEVTLSTRIHASDAYPGDLTVRIRYALTAEGLNCTLATKNTGPVSVPYGACPHPYLVAGPSGLDSWTLEVPSAAFLAVTPERLLPTGMQAVEERNFDFRSPRHLGAITVDHAFTDLTRDSAGAAAVRVFDPEGTGVELSFGQEWPWVQIYTGDKPIKPDRLGLAVEPMTCPPDAFTTGVDLVVLEPGAAHVGSWQIRAL